MSWFSEVFQGFSAYASEQKLTVLLFVVLMILWVKDLWKKEKVFVLFGIVTTLLCLCPVTAVLLMKYQTRFFDYQWIWTSVPCLVYVAYGITLLYKGLQEDPQKKRGQKYLVYILVVGALLLCISPRPKGVQTSLSKQERVKLETNLDSLVELAAGETICLWAPDDMMEYARSYNGDINLYYGRNINDKALNAYSYDTYSKRRRTAHKWMNGVCSDGKVNQGDIKGADCIKKAFRSGVTHIVIPKKTIRKSALKKLKKKANVKVYKIDDYIVLVKKGQ